MYYENLTESGKYVALPAGFAAFGSGIILNSILIITILRNRKELLKVTVDYLCLYFVCLAFMWSASSVVLFTLIFFNNGFSGGYGRILCQISGATIPSMVGGMISGHMMMAVERYMQIVKETQQTKKQLISVFLAISIWNIVCILYQLMQLRGFEPVEDVTYCFFPLNGPVNELSATIAILVICALCSVIIVNVYVTIYLKCYYIKRKVDQAFQTKLNRYAQQKLILIRCVLITCSFLILYSSTFLLLLYRLISNKYVPEWLVSLTGVLAGTDVILTPAIIYCTNVKVRESFRWNRQK